MEEQRQRAPHEDEDDKEGAGAPGVTALVDAVEPVECQPERQGEENKRPERRRNWTRIFSGTVATFTIVLAVVSIWQACITQQALDASKDATRIANRAWVGVKFGKLPDIEPGKKGRTTIYLSNSGNVPARNAIVFAVVLRAGVKKPVCSSRIRFTQSIGTRNDIAPEGRTRIPVPIGPYSEAEVAALKGPGRTKLLYLVGRVRYGDGFTKDDDAKTQFCVFWNPETGGFIGGGAFNAMR